MTKRPVKMLPVWIAISSVLIIAGILLFALLGFNHSAERRNNVTFEAEYDVVVLAEEKLDELKETIEKAFKDNGLSVLEFKNVESIDSSNGSPTSGGKLVYTFSANASSDALKAAKAVVEDYFKTLPEAAQVYADYHESHGSVFTEAAWRGAVAIAVGAVVALVYVGVRFGIGSALTGLTLCVHDVIVTLALLAITRIPLYYFAPMIIGAAAAFVSLLLWIVQCMKMRENFKDPSYAALSAEEAVEQSSKTAQKTIYVISGALGIVLAVIGIALAIAGSATGAILFPIVCILPVGVSVYSSLLFGPALHVHVKAAFDKVSVKRKRYFGRTKAEKNKANKEITETEQD